MHEAASALQTCAKATAEATFATPNNHRLSEDLGIDTGCGGVKAAGHGAQQRQGEEVSIGRAFSSRAVKASGVWTQRSSDDAPETGYGGSGLVRVGKSEGGHEDGEEVRTAHTKPKHGRRRRARERVKQNVTKGELLLSPRQWSMRARA